MPRGPVGALSFAHIHGAPASAVPPVPASGWWGLGPARAAGSGRCVSALPFPVPPGVCASELPVKLTPHTLTAQHLPAAVAPSFPLSL